MKSVQKKPLKKVASLVKKRVAKTKKAIVMSKEKPDMISDFITHAVDAGAQTLAEFSTAKLKKLAKNVERKVAQKIGSLS